jgi:flagellar biosynthesis/type III secretory pathway protein FliH
MKNYTVLHSHNALQICTSRLVIPASDLGDFSSAVQCAQALSEALSQEEKRIHAAACEAEKIGCSRGVQQGTQAAMQAFTEAVKKMAHDLHVQQETARVCLSALAAQVVYKIAHTLGASQVVPALITQAVHDLLPLQASCIRVSPHVAQAVRGTLQGVEIRGDDSLGAFDCVIDTVHGHNVVSLDSQLASICTALGGAPPTSPLPLPRQGVDGRLHVCAPTPTHRAANQDREIA